MIFSVTTLDYKITVFLYAWAFLLNLHSSAFHSRSHWRYVCRRQTRERLFKLRATRELNTFSCKWRSVAKQQQALKRLAIHIINTRENWLLFSESIFKRQGLKWGWLLRYRSFVSSQIEKKKVFSQFLSGSTLLPAAPPFIAYSIRFVYVFFRERRQKRKIVLCQ